MSTSTTSTPTPANPTAPKFDIRQLLRGDLGQLPVVLALIVMAVYFQNYSDGLYLSSRNLSNLFLQIPEVGIVSLGAVMVLLIGEIDLSLAVVANLSGAVLATQSVYHHVPPWGAMLMAIGVCAVIGFINGFIVSVIKVPAFIVTLAALLGYQGVLLHVLLPNTTIRITDPTLLGIASNYLPDWLGYTLGIGGIVLYGLYMGVTYYSRQRQQLSNPPLWQLGLQLGVVVLIVSGALYIFNGYFGVPYVAAIFIGFVTLFWIIMRFTTYGRYVYAVGGNAEAARRAGINVNVIRISIFMLASMLAGVAGILESSRTISASAQVDPTLLLIAIAAAVIGGVSLFGGRGSVWAVVMGALLMVGLSNGLVLQGRTSDIQFMIEAIVLILAVILDALIRRRSAA